MSHSAADSRTAVVLWLSSQPAVTRRGWGLGTKWAVRDGDLGPEQEMRDNVL